MTDEEFLHAFETATLPRFCWTHRAHVRMAYLYLRPNPDANALRARVRTGIQALNAAYRNPTGYHETITQAFLFLVADALRRNPDAAQTWETFCTHNPELLDFKTVLLPYYSRSLLQSPEARSDFVLPDLAPLP